MTNTTAPPPTNPSWTIPESATSPSDLTLTQTSVPNPGPNEVLIRLTAASLNYRDILISSHSPKYLGPHAPNLVPGSDGAGIIHSVGPTSIWAGKEGTSVVVHPNSWLSGHVRNLELDNILGGFAVDGTLRGWMVVSDERVIRAPEGLSGIECSTLLTAGATAWATIRSGLDGLLNGELEEWKGEGGWKEKRLEGQWVLTLGTGGVSCFAIQIAAALGATVIATSSSDEKLERAKTLGAAHTINYRATPNWDEEALRITAGRGVDHVLEVGGAQTLLKSLNSTRFGGLVTLIGILSSADSLPVEVVANVLYGAKTVRSCLAFNKDMSEEFVRFAEANGIKPVVAEVFPFDNVVAAFEALQNGKGVGKVVVEIS